MAVNIFIEKPKRPRRLPDALDRLIEQNRSLRDERLNPDMTLARTLRYVFATVVSGLLLLWLVPVQWQLYGFLAGLVLGAVGSMMVERERRLHARYAGEHKIQLPGQSEDTESTEASKNSGTLPKSDGFYILPPLLKTDGKINMVDRPHTVSYVTRETLIFLLIGGSLALLFTPLPVKLKIVVLLSSLVASWYIRADWKRTFAVVTDTRLVIVRDRPVPFDDNNQDYMLSAIADVKSNKPFWSQFLPGKNIATYITIYMFGGDKVTLPMLAHGDDLRRRLLDARTLSQGNM